MQLVSLIKVLSVKDKLTMKTKENSEQLIRTFRKSQTKVLPRNVFVCLCIQAIRLHTSISIFNKKKKKKNFKVSEELSILLAWIRSTFWVFKFHIRFWESSNWPWSGYQYHLYYIYFGINAAFQNNRLKLQMQK